MSDEYAIDEIMPILSDLVDKFTSYDSSSVTLKRANSLMEAVIFTINAFYTSISNGTIIYKKPSAKIAYENGYDILCKRVANTRKKYNEIAIIFDDYGNNNYRDTFYKGISAFFMKYDVRFSPCETVITMDYPIIGNICNNGGIFTVEDYIEKIGLEQKFLSLLTKDFIYKVLNEYQADYRDQFYNICSIILRNVLIRCITNDQSTEIDVLKLEIFLKGHTITETKFILRTVLEKYINEKLGDKNKLYSYLSGDLENFASRLYINLENNCLDRILYIDKGWK